MVTPEQLEKFWDYYEQGYDVEYASQHTGMPLAQAWKVFDEENKASAPVAEPRKKIPTPIAMQVLKYRRDKKAWTLDDLIR